jgi:enoyl-CoA hydratase/carnithine racemase
MSSGISHEWVSFTERDDGVALLRILRSNKKNALTVEMYETLTAALLHAEKSSSLRALVVLGSDGVFCAGNDLEDFLARPPTTEGSAVLRFLSAISTFPKPIVVGVDGPAVGIGTTLLFHCDYVVVTERAKLQMPFTKLGLVPEGASTVLLGGRLGHTKTMELLVLGNAFSGSEAVRLHIANEVAEPEALDARTLAVAAKYAALLPAAVMESKQLLKAPFQAAVAHALQVEGEAFVRRLQTPETQQILKAMLKR